MAPPAQQLGRGFLQVRRRSKGNPYHRRARLQPRQVSVPERQPVFYSAEGLEQAEAQEETLVQGR